MSFKFSKSACLANCLVFCLMLVSACSESTPSSEVVVVEPSPIPNEGTAEGSTNGVTDGEAENTAEGTQEGTPELTSDSGGDTEADNAVLEQVIPRFELVADKTIRISWEPARGAEFYRVLENADGLSGYSQISDDLDSSTQEFDHRVALYRKVNARYLVQACNSGGCLDSEELTMSGSFVNAIGYIKARFPDERDFFGVSVALNSDGTVLAIGADGDDSGSFGVNGNQTDNSIENTGAVYVFVRSDNRWIQQAYIKGSNSDSSDSFGWSLCLSGDGNTLAVGASYEDSATIGVYGYQPDNTAWDSGAVYVFTQTNGNWGQQAYLKASNTDPNDQFGYKVGCSEDGSTLAVSAVGEQSSSDKTDGQFDNSIPDAGAVYIFELYKGIWEQQAFLKADSVEAGSSFGVTLDLSADGETLAVSSFGDSKRSTGDGNQTGVSEDFAGTVYIFERLAGVWVQEFHLTATNTEDGNFLNTQLSLSADGDTLAVTAFTDGISDLGAVYVFDKTDENWQQHARIESSNIELADHFGNTVNLSGDGNTLLVGASGEDSSARGIGGDQFDNTALESGAAYVFKRSNGLWQQQAYLKASNSTEYNWFSNSSSISSDGNTIAIGARSESNRAMGINSNQNGGTLTGSGAVYLY